MNSLEIESYLHRGDLEIIEWGVGVLTLEIKV